MEYGSIPSRTSSNKNKHMQSDNQSSNKRIAKNTLLLYIRMLFIMAVSLYTSRVILQTLGVDDYGIYNVVGGFVAMLAYLNSVFVDSSQRFISYTIGLGDRERLRKVFITSFTIQIIIAAIILIAAETIGLWFVNNKLVIDPSRLNAANWVYQCSILSLIVTILNVPHRACIVAHEQMSIYAYVSIVEAVLKLVIVYLLLIVDMDKLILYSLSYLFVSIVIPLWFTIYCIRRNEESSLGVGLDKDTFREMFSYSVWIMVGNLGFSFKDQLSNIIMNLFLGTVINAARGIATQVNGVIMSFANNFLMALSPQITQQYAAKNYDRCVSLTNVGARFSFYLMGIITIPLIVNINYVLHLWLGIVPEYTSAFVVITLIASVYYAASKTLTVAIQASGDVKLFQIVISLIMLTEIPIAYVLLKFGFAPYYALLPMIFTNIAGILFRLFLVHRLIPSYSIFPFVYEILIKGTVLLAIVYASSRFINGYIPETFWGLLLNCVITLAISIIVVYTGGMTHDEKNIIKKYIANHIKK